MSTVTPSGRIVEKGTKVIQLGDHVEDRECRDNKMVVVGLPRKTAEECTFRYGGSGPEKTVAEVNPDYPADDRVVEVKFVGETDRFMPDKTYSYPAGRLEVVNSLHEA